MAPSKDAECWFNTLLRKLNVFLYPLFSENYSGGFPFSL